MSLSPLISRPRLLRRLTAALRQGHVLIGAPPGYGKSTLLRTFAASVPNAYYVMLTIADSDVSRLQARLGPLLHLNATLLIDDVHHLQAATEAVSWLAQQMDAMRARFIVSGRQIPAVLESRPSRAQLTHFTATDLAFTATEAHALLADRAASPGWHARAQGWPLALALLAQQPAIISTPNL